MKNSVIRLATAAAIIVAIMVGMYVLTGSAGGTSITIAQVRQAMQEIDWMRVRNKNGPEVAWYAFASKIQIGPNDGGGIIYFDFNTGKQQVWKPDSAAIYESPIDENRQLAGGASGPSESIDKFFDSLENDGWEVTKEIGTYEGRKVEVWRAGPKTSTLLLRMYIDAERKLPVALTQETKEPDGTTRIQTEAVFDYPQTGPADIYEAGAPRSAQIVPAPEQ